MSVNWKTSAIVGGSAFVLSALVGLIGGVGFGVLVLRAAIGAALFAAGAAAVEVVIERFLPELRSTADAAPAPTGSGRVDIVVDDDLSSDGYTPGGTFGDDFDGGSAESDDAYGSDADDDGAFASSPDDTGEFDDGVGSSGRSEGGAIDDDEPEELEAVDVDGTPERGPISDDADNLPDMDRMSESFQSGVASVVDARTDGVDGGGRSGEDPSLMARAIRTVLKREQ
ncbi:MAG: hypothetical protein EA382_10295 [Spirochaetaceae bacterium]|nr:MAG: hypothetical protein EA382_10295 [Spirochaetaceae bacterium]